MRGVAVVKGRKRRVRKVGIVAIVEARARAVRERRIKVRDWG